MNAHALLSAQGWRGTGHSLHKTDDSIGLAKPLLLSRKDNTQGLGQKQHFTSDQWWMNAFDEQLKGLDTSKKGMVIQTVTSGKLNSLDKNAGKYSVYSSFVRGGFLEGTLDKLKIRDASTSPDSTESSDEDSADQKTIKTKVTETRKETKEERRARKEAKQKRKEERARRRTARQERRSLKKAKKSSAESSEVDEEKARRRARKEEKRKQRKKEAET